VAGRQVGEDMRKRGEHENEADGGGVESVLEAEAEADNAVERMRLEAMSEDRAKQQTEIRRRVVLPARFRGWLGRAKKRLRIERRPRQFHAGTGFSLHTPRKQCGIAALYKAFVRGPSAAGAANSLALPT
jgi:hypothetical protein